MRLQSTFERLLDRPATPGGTLVGRVPELARIVDGLSRPDPPVFVVSGRAGVGKTRLAHAVADTMSQRFATYWVQADPAGRGIPLGVFDAAEHSDGDPLTHFAELHRTLAGPTQTGVLIVDDVQNADDLSLFLLRRLAADPSTPTRLLLTFRTEGDIPPAVADLLRLPSIEIVPLQPLSIDETRQLLTSVGRDDPDLVEQIWRRTQGNPLFVTALAGSDPTDDLPDDLAAAVETLLARVDDPSVIDVVEILAETESLDLATLSELAGSAAVEAAEDSGLILVTRGGGYTTRLAHPLFGEVLRTRGDRRHRLDIRRRVLAHYRSVPHDYASSIRVAGLAVDTPDAPGRDGAIVRGAQSALRVLDLPLAARLAAHVGPGPMRLRADILRGYTAAALSDTTEAKSVLTCLRTDSSDPGVIESVRLIMAGGSWTLGRPRALRAIADDASSSTETRAAIGSFLSAMAGRPAESVALLPNDVAPPTDPNSIGGVAMNALVSAIGRITATGQIGDIDALRSAVSNSGRLIAGSVMVASQQTIIAAAAVTAAALTGDVGWTDDVAASFTDRLAPFPGISEQCVAGLRAVTALAAGRVHESVEHGVRALDGFDALGTPVYFWYPYCVVTASAAAHAGDLGTARSLLARLRTHPHAGFAHLSVFIDLVRARCAPAGRRGALAVTAADRAAAADQHAVEVFAVQCALRFGVRGLSDRARELAARTPGLRRGVVTGLHARALDTGDPDAMMRVARFYETDGDAALAADAVAQAAMLHAEAGALADAVDIADRAHRRADGIGLDSPAVRASDDAIGLTAHQRRIVVLARTGSSNREIAVRTGLSVRTVEGHLYRASRVLGTAVRTNPPKFE
ncbi:putative regulatory protein, LuxR [Gordonia spumicola]|uniref:Putative regulatory protein, LuxR n=1 Tax=Gordonia spumicola TaxID=589161 RepID=A0A7I9V679_9ACTN|nr:AAA family ATPase [Gordonia spumicola]GEE00916.1 putative regulatory protein, LuxR [Gordonia spumicola]